MFNRYMTLSHLKELQTGARLNLDNHTYVIRQTERYVAYRTWMSVMPLIEVFGLGEEGAVVGWLERFGYSFETEMSGS